MYDHDGFTFDEIFESYTKAAERLAPYVCDTSKLLDDAFTASQNVLFEGAQGVMLDIDHGTYPFVTSSNPIAGNVTVGCGVAANNVKNVIGVCKAYTSRWRWSIPNRII